MPEEILEPTQEGTAVNQQMAVSEETVISDQQSAAGETAPELPVTESGEIDYEALSDDQLEEVLRIAAAQETGDEPETEETGEEPDEPDDEARTAEPSEAFTFTENPDDETFMREADEYLERFEDTPETAELKRIVEGYKSRVEQARADYEGLGDIQTAKRFQGAIDEMVTKARIDGDVFVPDTTAFRQIMRENLPNEYVQVLQDELGAPSEKYHGYSLMEELIADGFGFTDAKKRASLEHFLRSGGETQIPPFIPENVDGRLAEAYWKSIDRDDLDAKLREYNEILNDDAAYEEEKADARRGIEQINQKLEQIQIGLDSAKKDRQDAVQRQQAEREKFENQVMANYQNTAISLEREFTDKIASKLTMFGENSAAARITGRSIATLVRDALTDNEAFAAAARADLKEMGVKFDWQKGYDALDRLYRTERELAFKEANEGKVNPRSVEITRRAKADILKEIKLQETELFGKIMTILQSGANNALQSKAKPPAQTKARLVLKGKAAGASVGGNGRGDDIDAKFAHLSDVELARLSEAEKIFLQRQQKS